MIEIIENIFFSILVALLGFIAVAGFFISCAEKEDRYTRKENEK